LLPDLLGAVKSPDYLLPDIPEADHVVLAIIASKSNPLTHKGAHKTTGTGKTSLSEAAESEQNANGKYMVLTLTDLKWTVDLFLFSTGYTRFRKLTPGTVVALLNPDIMPPPPGRAVTGRFSLKLSSSDDTVLEIGTSRDLGWCKSVRKDGKQCDSWIDKRHTEFCEFHVDVVVERTRRGRMEVQGMSAPFAPGGKKGGRTGYFGDKGRGPRNAKENGLAREGARYNRGSGSTYFICPSLPGGRSAAQLLDAEGAMDRGGSKQERVRKRLAERERENEIARKLGEGGNGAGSEYLRLRQGGQASASDLAQLEAPDPVDATSLGLLGNRATNVHLSPIKKRKGSVLGDDGARKKTRFVTDRGIKEAGRESLGGEIAMQGGDDQDEDDGLEVI
jgi:minichromosome maintenance protein 10